MQLRDYMKFDCGDEITITVKKDKHKYQSTYSVCLFTKAKAVKVTCKDRKSAKREFIRLVMLYTSLTISQILRL